jgi:hypothetical protein
MLRAVASRHRCVSHYHGASGTSVSTFDEATLSLGGPIEVIDAIRRIEIDGVAFDVDPVRRAIHHPEHSDPAVPFLHNGIWWLQVFLCDGRYKTELPAQAAAWSGDGTIDVGRVEFHVADADALMTSRMSGPPGARLLTFDAPTPTDIVVQTSAFGREMEQVMPTRPAGPGTFPIEAVHAERYGICLSSGDPFGGIEHKHMIFGQGGHASGRVLIDAKGFWLPKVREQFGYRSVILLDDGGDWVGNALRDPLIDEIDVWTTLDRAGAVRGMLGQENLSGRKITTYASKASVAAHAADVNVVEPGDEVPARKTISFLLFMDQAASSFPERYAATIRHLRTLPASINVIDRAWIGAKDIPSLTNRHFGMAFSRSTETSANAKVNLFKRLAVPDFQPCGSCEAKPFCLSFAATPLAMGMLPSNLGCRIRDAAA